MPARQSAAPMSQPRCRRARRPTWAARRALPRQRRAQRRSAQGLPPCLRSPTPTRPCMTPSCSTCRPLPQLTVAPCCKWRNLPLARGSTLGTRCSARGRFALSRSRTPVAQRKTSVRARAPSAGRERTRRPRCAPRSVPVSRHAARVRKSRGRPASRSRGERVIWQGHRDRVDASRSELPR